MYYRLKFCDKQGEIPPPGSKSIMMSQRYVYSDSEHWHASSVLQTGEFVKIQHLLKGKSYIFRIMIVNVSRYDSDSEVL